MQKETKRSKTRLGDEPPPPPSSVHVPDLPEDLVAEILTRLPSKSVLRARAVSSAWRRITTDPVFFAAHARRRPLEIVIHSTTAVTCPCDYPLGYHCQDDAVLDTIPVSDLQQPDRRHLIRYPNWTCKPPHRGCLVIASCEGILLLKVFSGGNYRMCNPMTRQWCELPRLPKITDPSSINEYGFYYHQASGEYRLLCRYSTQMTSTTAHTFYILSAAATEPRFLSMAGVDEEVITIGDYGCVPVALHGRLHWLRWPMPCRPTGRMVVFDTESETFHLMMLPPTPSMRVKIFAMDGQLVAAEFANTMQIDLWFLEDYANNGRWECRHQISTPPIYVQLRAAQPDLVSRVLYTVEAGTNDGDIILRPTNNGIVVYNVKKRTSRVVMVMEENNNSTFMCHVFRESLVQHECFKAPPSNGFPLINSTIHRLPMRTY
ncbi:hypothetical protein EJB05_51114, partial [Eragrostis curvula]